MAGDTENTLYFGKYELLEICGEGGMAKVWRATMRWAAGFQRLVAIKQILPSLTSNSKFVAMFIEEARVGSQLNHANIVQIIDFGVDIEKSYYLVMEWIEGLNLRQYLEAFKNTGKRTPWPLITAIGIEALRGLGAAHDRIDHTGVRAPVIHRDVTPQNILVGTNGIIKLTDFGLSRAADRSKTTHPKIIKGKLSYLSPEVAWSKEATARSDVFCLALVLWEALSGHQVYQGKTDVDVFLQAREAEVPDITEFRDDLPDELVETLARALQVDPADRFDSAQDMLRALAHILRHDRYPTDAMEISKSVIRAREVLGMPRFSPPPPSPLPPPPPAVEDEAKKVKDLPPI